MSENDNKENLILSAHVADSAEVFPKILELHVSNGATIADVTYGNGIFWKKVDKDKYNIVAADIDPKKSPTGESVDCRDLPYENGSFDCVILDPPHIEGYYRKNKKQLPGSSSHSPFRESYSNGKPIEESGKYHQRVLNMYFKSGEEAYRILEEGGILIAKMVDEICSNKQELTHIQVTNYYQEELDFYPKDLFILVRTNQPHINGIENQKHARKNHSYFIVYEKN